jgi:hypothetical protein
MANVKRGAQTAGGRTVARPEKRAEREAKVAEARPRRKASPGVQYQGDTDHLWAYPPKPILGPGNEVVGQEPGLFVEFHGGRTKTFYPERYASDAVFVERMDAWLASGDRTAEKYSIARVEPDKPKLPFEIGKWNVTNAKRLKEVLELLLGEDEDANRAAVDACVLYEQEGAAREEVLEMLAGLLGDGETEDALDAEFTV